MLQHAALEQSKKEKKKEKFLLVSSVNIIAREIKVKEVIGKNTENH
jgi:hypothetical protein